MFELKPESYKTAFLAVLKRLSTFHEEHYLFLKNCFSVTGKLSPPSEAFFTSQLEGVLCPVEVLDLA